MSGRGSNPAPIAHMHVTARSRKPPVTHRYGIAQKEQLGFDSQSLPIEPGAHAGSRKSDPLTPRSLRRAQRRSRNASTGCHATASRSHLKSNTHTQPSTTQRLKTNQHALLTQAQHARHAAADVALHGTRQDFELQHLALVLTTPLLRSQALAPEQKLTYATQISTPQICSF